MNFIDEFQTRARQLLGTTGAAPELVEKCLQVITRPYHCLLEFDERNPVYLQVESSAKSKMEADLTFIQGALLFKSDVLYRFLETPALNARQDLRKFMTEYLLKHDSLEYGSRYQSTTMTRMQEPIYAFHAVSAICSKDRPDMGVVVGPEGYAYAPLFELHGLPLRHIHIDEYCTTEDRPYTELDSVKDIEGKRIILIEDDVVSGRTLEKAIQKLSPHNPREYQVYLGIREAKQQLGNVPKIVTKTYATPDHLADPVIFATVDEALTLLETKHPIYKHA